MFDFSILHPGMLPPWSLADGDSSPVRDHLNPLGESQPFWIGPSFDLDPGTLPSKAMGLTHGVERVPGPPSFLLARIASVNIDRVRVWLGNA